MKKRLIYINLDGFGKYYYDGMPERRTELKGIEALKKIGCFFENAYTGIPSITFPMQSAIVSGCYSEGTGNCDKIWDRERNEVIPLRRLNRAETIGEVLKREHIETVSIQQFTLENRGCRKDDPRHLYVQPGGDYKRRFDILDRLIREKEIETDSGVIRYGELPEAIFVYIDDLDTIGHNPDFCRQKEECGRVEKVQERLREIDGRISSLLEILEKQGLLENTYVLLTTDHGMISYQEDKTEALKSALEEWGFSKVGCCWEGAVSEGTQVLLTGHGIQCQVYLPQNTEEPERQRLKRYLETLEFTDQVLTAGELAERGVCREYGDLVVSPKEGIGFSFGSVEEGRLYASHDSLHEKCQHIFAVLTGPDIKKGYVEKGHVENIDFIPSLAERMGWERPENAAGSLPGSVFTS